MQQKSTIPFLTILFHLLFVPFLSNAGTFQENQLTKAIQLFDKEKYTEAEPIFKKLLDDRPDDFMVNYFYGACRTENGHYSEQDLNYLVKASKEVTPLNIDYYLAVQYHAKNQWEKAAAYYKLYKTIASTNDQENVGLSMKMEQCSNQINPFATSETVENEKLDPIEQEILTVSDSTIEFFEPEADTLLVNIIEEEATPGPVTVLPVEERIKFSVNNEITYNSVSNFKTDEGRIYFQEGSLKKAELGKVILRTEILREKYNTLQSRAERDSVGQHILSLEGQAYDLKSEETQLFLQAKSAENGYWQNASPEETEAFIKELNTASQELENRKVVDVEVVPESPVLIIPPILIANGEIESSAQKEKPSGIIYKIQIGAYSRGIPSTQKQAFNKISIIRKVENYTDENGVVVYTTGNLTNYDDAVQMQNQVKQEGIKDPKIAAYFNGKRITLEQAKEIENKK